MEYKTREQQRQDDLAGKMASIGLEAHLRNTATDALTGSREAMAEFQQAVQYAPAEMKSRMVDFITQRMP